MSTEVNVPALQFSVKAAELALQRISNQNTQLTVDLSAAQLQLQNATEVINQLTKQKAELEKTNAELKTRVTELEDAAAPKESKPGTQEPWSGIPSSN